MDDGGCTQLPQHRSLTTRRPVTLALALCHIMSLENKKSNNRESKGKEAETGERKNFNLRPCVLVGRRNTWESRAPARDIFDPYSHRNDVQYFNCFGLSSHFQFLDNEI